MTVFKKTRAINFLNFYEQEYIRHLNLKNIGKKTCIHIILLILLTMLF